MTAYIECKSEKNRIGLTIKLPWMTKTEFLLTISIQYHPEKWWEQEKYQLGDNKSIQYQILQTNISRTVQQKVTRITNEILGVKGLIQAVI